MGGIALFAAGQASDGHTGKMAWDLYRAVEAGQQQRAVGDDVESITAVLLTRAEATDAGLQILRSFGYSVIGAMGRFIMVEAPADRFADAEVGLDVLDFVTNASLPPPSLESAAPTITNGTAAIGAEDVWNLGYRGDDVVIALIDDGFDLDNTTLAGHNPIFYTITPSPEKVGTYSTEIGEAAQPSPHGTSCAIIAGDVAPDAQIHVLSYPKGTAPLGWIFAVHYAVYTLGADVVSTSVEFGGSYCHADGTGPVNELISRFLADSGTALVIAAGNWAGGSGSSRWHYEARFVDSDGDFNHDFTADADTAWDRNTLRFSARKGDQLLLFMEWDDWGADSHREDLDLYILDSQYHVVVGESKAQQFGGTSNPVEGVPGGGRMFVAPATGDYCIRVRNRAAAAHGEATRPVHFNLFALSKSGPFAFVEHSTSCGSIREAATHPQAVAVGAVAVDTQELRDYSSRGPTGGGLDKPELCAPDGVSGTAYPSFTGSSASAPYVAGALALLRSADPDATVNRLVRLLQDTATTSVDDCGNPVYAIDVLGAMRALLEE